MRWLLENEIRDMEDDLAAICKQRANDNEAEKMISAELAKCRRHMQALIQADVQQTTADLVRRIKL